MKEKLSIFILYFFLIICCNQRFYAQQQDSKRTGDKEIYLSAERIFLHINSTFFLPGETIYYKFYCLDADTKKMSSLSKVSYVELINEKKEILFTHKIELNAGVGQGEYFIPTSLPSGNYKIIGFTQLAKNLGLEYMFQNDITIVNPYKGNQSTLLSKNQDTINNSKMVVKEKEMARSHFAASKSGASISSQYATLQLLDSVFGRRQKITLKVKSEIDDVQKGAYSISVRRVDTIPIAPKFSATTWFQNVGNKSKKVLWNSDNIIPELRGNLVRGKIVPKNKEVDSLSQQPVAISIPGKAYELKVVRTNDEGFFWYNIENKYDEDEIIAQVLGSRKDEFDVEMEFYPLPKIDYKALKFDRFYLQPEMKQMILDRSVQNQIKNGYFSVKRDTIKLDEDSVSPLDGMYDVEYTLDNFTRFPSVPETMIEVVDNVWISKDKSGNQFFKIRPTFTDVRPESFPTLVIVDGLVLQNHEYLINYPASKINKINVIRDDFIVGAEIFSGVLEAETLESDFFNSIDIDYVYKSEIFKPLKNKVYFKQQYRDSLKPVTDRIPDFRNQLLWDPSVEMSEKEKDIWFYTSDNSGVYEIDITGFTATGKPISMREVFRVE